MLVINAPSFFFFLYPPKNIALLSDTSIGRVVNNDSGDIACDHFSLYEEDVQIMKVRLLVQPMRARGARCVYRCDPTVHQLVTTMLQSLSRLIVAPSFPSNDYRCNHALPPRWKRYSPTAVTCSYTTEAAPSIPNAACSFVFSLPTKPLLLRIVSSQTHMMTVHSMSGSMQDLPTQQYESS